MWGESPGGHKQKYEFPRMEISSSMSILERLFMGVKETGREEWWRGMGKVLGWEGSSS